MFNKEDYETDKSWGMIGCKRVQGTAMKVFGSDVTTNNAVIITIKRAEKTRSLRRTWCHGSENIAEVMLTPTQFAEMITLMNYGDGVPCTIRFTQKEGFIEPKEEVNKIELIQREREAEVEQLSEELDEALATVQSLIDARKLSKRDSEKLSQALNNIKYQFDGNARRFINNQAKQELDKMVQEAKTNIQEYVDYKVHETGLRQIAELGCNSLPLELEGGKDE